MNLFARLMNARWKTKSGGNKLLVFSSAGKNRRGKNRAQSYFADFFVAFFCHPFRNKHNIFYTPSIFFYNHIFLHLKLAKFADNQAENEVSIYDEDVCSVCDP